MKIAIVEPSGRVAQIVARDEIFELAPGLALIECGDDVTTRHVWDGTDFIAPAPEPAAAPLAYWQQRAEAYAAQLADHQNGIPAHVIAMGDMLDALQKEVRSLRQAVGGTADADFADKAAKIDAIKAQFPKP